MSLLAWRLLIYGGIVLAFGGWCAYEMHGHDQRKLAQLQSDFDVFKGGVAALGNAANERAKATDAANLKRKQDADAENGKTKADLAGLYAAYASLRDSRKGAGSGVLPEAGGKTGSPPILTFNRAALDRGLEEADGVLQSGAAKILYRGDKAITDLNTARRWANGQAPPP